MFWVSHHVWGEGVEGDYIGDLGLFLSVNFLQFFYDIGIDDFISREEEVSDFFFSEMELDSEFSSY